MSLQSRGTKAAVPSGSGGHRGYSHGVLGALCSLGGFCKHQGEQRGDTCLGFFGGFLGFVLLIIFLFLFSSKEGQGWLSRVGCAQENAGLQEFVAGGAEGGSEAQKGRKGAEHLPKF